MTSVFPHIYRKFNSFFNWYVEIFMLKNSRWIFLIKVQIPQWSVYLISVVFIEDSDFILIRIWCENNYHFFCIRIYTHFRNDRLMLNWIAIIFWNTKTHIYFFPSALSVYKSFHRLLEDPPLSFCGWRYLWTAPLMLIVDIEQGIFLIQIY